MNVDFQDLDKREDYHYNGLQEIENLRQEVIHDKTQTYHDALFKIIIIGDSGIGKSCLLKRLMEDDFKEDHDVTVGVEFGSYLIKVEEKILKLQVWDTAGQESFKSITKIFYRGAHVVILTYSTINGLTFDNIKDWLKDVRTQCAADVMLFIVGTKSDLHSMREVAKEQALDYKDKNGIMYFAECSAKSGDGVERLFADCSRFIYAKYKDKIGQMGDLSESDADGAGDGNKDKQAGSFSQSRGHRAGRLRADRQKKKKKKGCKC